MLLGIIMEIICKPIGIVHSPFMESMGTPIQPTAGKDVKGKIEVFPEFESGLDGVEGFSHIIVVFHFHLSEKTKLKVVPYLDNKEKGVFATRAPSRPNHIGISVVRLEKIEGNLLFVKDLDIINGTPVLDIKPFIPELNPKKARKGWLEKKEKGFRIKKDEGEKI